MPAGAFQPIYPNPYIAGNPIRSKEMFFGRVDEFRFIERLLEGGHKTALIVLYGERRSGKSSILYQILNGELGEAFLPIFIDMQIMAGIATDAEFFGRIITDVCKTLAKNSLVAETYTTRLQESNSTEFFRKFLQDLKAQHPHRAELMLVDEYEILEAKIAEGSLSRHVLTFFAGLLETEQVSFVFTGSRELEAHDQALWQGELLRKATSRKISFLTEEDTARLVKQPLQGKVTLAPEVVAEIYALTAGQPFYTQLICQNLVYHLNEVKKREVKKADLQAVVDGIIENPPPQLLFNWSEHSPERKLTLAVLAEYGERHDAYLAADELCRRMSRSKLGIELERNFFNTELDGLLHDEHVLQKGRRYSYRLDLYRQWVRHDHSVWQVKKEIGPRDMARMTKETRRKRAKRKKAASMIEHALLIILVLVGIVLAKQLIDRIWPKQVKVTANAWPFMVFIDGESVGTSKDEVDSTTFVYDEKELSEGPHILEVTLLKTGETLSQTVVIKSGIAEIFQSRTTLVRFQFLEPPVIIDVRANAGPFILFIDGDSVGSTRGREDSTAFFIMKRLNKGRHDVKAMLMASDETWSDTITPVGSETTEVGIFFPESLVTISADAVNFVARLNGKVVIDTKSQPEGWRSVFHVAKGDYTLHLTDSKTKEVLEERLTVSKNSETFHFDFEQVVVLTLKATAAFQYKYEWHNLEGVKKKESRRPHSGSTLVMQRGIEKGVYQFTFENAKHQKKELHVIIRRDTTITIEFPPPPKHHLLTIITIEPVEATVLLNGREIGTTTFVGEFDEGTYLFELCHEGYDSLAIPINLYRDFEITKSLEPQFGELLVVVKDLNEDPVPDAAIFLNDEKEEWARAPMGPKRIRAGTHKITVLKSSFRAESKIVRVRKGKPETVQFSLSR
ncbi:MAG: hypothetical protein ACREOO_24655 [bacterium]